MMPSQTAFRVLCVIANPSDLPPFDSARAWANIAGALQSHIQANRVALERAADASEAGIRALLQQKRFEAVHLVAHAQARGANYTNVALQTAEGRSRPLTAPAVANLLVENKSLRLCILEACDDRAFYFDAVARAIAGYGVTVVAVPRRPELYGQGTLVKLYAALLDGATAEQLAKELAGFGVQVTAGHPGEPIFALAQQAAAPASTPPAVPVAAAQPPAWHEVLHRKRASGIFDVFLCHNSGDKPAVKRIGQRLKETGVLPWLDEWELPPGQPWQPLLEQQIGNIRAAAVFVGSAGLGPWQEQEMYGFLREFVDRKAPVIPVLLPDAPATPALPLFLKAMTWVDFRKNDPDPFRQLVWGITGERPEL
jgi:hypothetical protein